MDEFSIIKKLLHMEDAGAFLALDKDQLEIVDKCAYNKYGWRGEL